MGGRFFGASKAQKEANRQREIAADREAGVGRAEQEIATQRAQPKFQRASQRLLAGDAAPMETAAKKLLGG
jgi:hypothetical protein